MKQGIVLGIILTSALTLLYAIHVGMFQSTSAEYTTVKLPDVVDYNFHIKPILSDNCYTCHGPDANKRKAGLRLDLEAAALSELPESPGKFAIVPGKTAQSLLYQHIMADDPEQRMPPPESNLTLTLHEKRLLAKWIDQGAKFDRHWAYIPPKKGALPNNTSSAWEQNEIDAFILAKMEANGLVPSKKASKETLLRRLSLDLTGLPPTAEQIQKFLTPIGDTLDIAQVINEFLAMPQYGERMAQVWLDVARYADSHGYQDDSYRTMWPWRDWVIHAFNRNMPYDEFITLQLAGDLLPNATLEQVLATGFNRNHPITQEGGVIQEEYQSYYVTDRTNTLGKGILGITLECAKCHDHKYDAFSQRDYFEMYAFFNNVNEKGLQMDAVQAANQKYFADAPFITITDKETADVLSFINKPKGKDVKVMVMDEAMPRPTFIFDRGQYDALGEEVVPATPEAILPFPESYPKNRLGLAQWVSSTDNPLTARVFVNRTWAMLFGKGLVETAEDFGVQGSLPTHPELLDWLSKDFMEHDWDIQYLLRKIMSSATYQQSSIATEEIKLADPENNFYTRASRFRMSGEMIRDYVLATSGLLNQTIGGESVSPYQPEGLWEETNAGGNRGVLTSYVQDEGDKLYRRSLYTIWKRTLPPPTMTLFDAPNRDICEVRRQKTNTPLQALALQNDVQMLEAARVLAQYILLENKNENDVVRYAFQKIMIRNPKKEELEVLEGYYQDALQTFLNNPENAEKLIAQGAYQLPRTDPSKTAALMLTAQVIYNLDETITKE
ncbi:PSD1 and planctomycete cytochrome C domain-containing protein [Arenibacter sp. GZD96]|uniref:PSD1 and planctomycete cytochrome C domain-containing protein n=1 Tax=Aurantibrevibacter litoralis TaxID=3106030 RepID=UPI002AFDF7D9|nr:PSD1 and planctomycete cytochrome C domain-containing protein [Arenibacter sp. GZD-96]MEA1786985.1 PSD1 and planctomycete cytochrome C domain-containing protein [Arenibacter sp. GZD-96]